MRRSQPVKAHDVSPSAVELVVMAAQILDHPESRLHRTALAHAAAEVIRAQGDKPVLNAIELAPDLRVARVIRAAAEAACETVSVSSNGKERCARLFCVPVVVRFSESMTTREFDDKVTQTSWSAAFLARLHECGARHSISSILTHAFLFDDLAGLSFSSVRNGTIMASASSTKTYARMNGPFPISTSAQRRSATFLRYLLGYQVKCAAMPDDGAEDRGRFGDCVRSVMLASMPDALDVLIVYTGYFYEPIWQGLWLYHIHRLAEVVRTLTPRCAQPSALNASVTVTGSNDQMAAEVTFFLHGKRVEHHAFRLPLRPLADAKTSGAQIAAELGALGVRPTIVIPGSSIRRTHRSFTSRRSAASCKGATSELTIPL